MPTSDRGSLQRPQEILPNPDPSVITTEMIDRAVSNLEDKSEAKIDGLSKQIATRFEAIDKATNAFHEDMVRVPTILDRAITSLRELLEQRLDGMDKLHIELQNDVKQRPTAVREAIASLHALMIERIETSDVKHAGTQLALREVTMSMFEGVKEQFAQVAVQTDKAALAVKEAVKDAFAAAKEVVSQQNISNTLSNDKSEKAVAKLIDGINDQVKSIVKAMDDKFNDVKDRVTIIEGKQSVSDPTTTASLREIISDMRSLQTSRDTTQGRAAVVDPALIDALRKMDAQIAALAASRDTIAGQKAGTDSTWAFGLTVAGVAIPLTGLIMFLIAKFT